MQVGKDVANHHLLEDLQLKKSSHATPNNQHNICSVCYQILPYGKKIFIIVPFHVKNSIEIVAET